VKEDKKIYILYFGNFDLFNNNIDKIINNALLDFNLNIDFKKIAVTENQMRKFHLPENPNPKIIRKLDSNLRKDYFIKKYQAYAPEKFKNMVLESVNNIFQKYQNCENIKNCHLMA
jgi:nitrate/TMAO reductase-like tetraheme cytochrome c subunit